MTYLSFVTILGPFGSNQLIAASNAICSETKQAFGRVLSFAWLLPCCRSDVASRSNRSMAPNSAAILSLI